MAKRLTKEMLQQMGIRITILPDAEYLIERYHPSKGNKPGKWVTLTPVENLTYHVRSQKIKKYYNIGWSYNGKPVTFPLHRVIYAYFFGEVPEGRDIHHIDGCGFNNSLANLAVVTRKENLKERKGYSNGHLKEFKND